MNRSGRSPTVILLMGMVWLTLSGHAFPERSEPRVGSTVKTPPAAVRIWFDGRLESAFSLLRVEDSEGNSVDNADSRVNPEDDTVLEVSLPPVPAGRYRVSWIAVAVDGHRTEGDFSFTVESMR